MYCKKCHEILTNESSICASCGFDNHNEYDQENTAVIDLAKINAELNKKEVKKKHPIVHALFGLIIISTFITLSIFIKSTKANVIEETTTSTTTTTDVPTYATFTYNNLTMQYPDTFGSTASTIFYKDYTSINIEVSSITAETYNELLSTNDCLKSTLGSYSSDTYANDSSYGYLISYQGAYYKLVVNYVSNKTIYNESVQTNIQKILNSIKLG
ncbi:MAG TPA: hypothetical protein PLB45_00420 [Bacilli bacterium]|jgi:RNA polymerase subunit RPABC4/transcription elongation factor Spt4|nr:hypothetical protein [Bacilli bacterium]